MCAHPFRFRNLLECQMKFMVKPLEVSCKGLNQTICSCYYLVIQMQFPLILSVLLQTETRKALTVKKFKSGSNVIGFQVTEPTSISQQLPYV